MSDTPRTDARCKWFQNDVRYKAPEQAFATVVKHNEMLVEDCRALEREIAELNKEAQILTDDLHNARVNAA